MIMFLWRYDYKPIYMLYKETKGSLYDGGRLPWYDKDMKMKYCLREFSESLDSSFVW